MYVEVNKGKRRLEKKWLNVIKSDMKTAGIGEYTAGDRIVWILRVKMWELNICGRKR